MVRPVLSDLVPAPAMAAHGVILGLETSCDDTCAAVLSLDGRTLSSVVSSQGIHAEYLGVVPELASRAHLSLVGPAVRQALDLAGCALSDVSGIAVTRGPGLIGCLLVGLAMAKGLAIALGKPLVGVNHIEGHLHAIQAERRYEPPFVALVASGGHTELVQVEAWGRYRLLGATRDDAAGEAFDKVAKLMGLGFPGGAVIDRLARQGDPRAIPFPRAWLDLERGGLDFSFSGLKTAVRNHLERSGFFDELERTSNVVEGGAGDEAGEALGSSPGSGGPDPGGGLSARIADVAASFQAALVDVLEAKIEAACRLTSTRRILLCGGVACNSALRARITELATRLGGEAAYPSPALCSDNAVMIALAGRARLLRGESDPLDIPAVAGIDELGWG